MLTWFWYVMSNNTRIIDWFCPSPIITLHFLNSVRLWSRFLFSRWFIKKRFLVPFLVIITEWNFSFSHLMRQAAVCGFIHSICSAFYVSNRFNVHGFVNAEKMFNVIFWWLWSNLLFSFALSVRWPLVSSVYFMCASFSGLIFSK